MKFVAGRLRSEQVEKNSAFTRGKMILDRNVNVGRQLKELLEKPHDHVIIGTSGESDQNVAVVVRVGIQPETIGDGGREIIQPSAKQRTA